MLITHRFLLTLTKDTNMFLSGRGHQFPLALSFHPRVKAPPTSAGVTLDPLFFALSEFGERPQAALTMFSDACKCNGKHPHAFPSPLCWGPPVKGDPSWGHPAARPRARPSGLPELSWKLGEGGLSASSPSSPLFPCLSLRLCICPPLSSFHTLTFAACHSRSLCLCPCHSFSSASLPLSAPLSLRLSVSSLLSIPHQPLISFCLHRGGTASLPSLLPPPYKIPFPTKPCHSGAQGGEAPSPNTPLPGLRGRASLWAGHQGSHVALGGACPGLDALQLPS